MYSFKALLKVKGLYFDMRTGRFIESDKRQYFN